jgi:hypothetical protein
MQRIVLPLAALGLLAVSLTGCCCHGCGHGAHYAPACPPANPCPPAYGTFGAAPMMAPGNCPGGNCGMYPTGSYYGPSAPIAAAGPTVYTTAALPMNPLPTY